MTAPLTPDQERAALAACEAATPGPWVATNTRNSPADGLSTNRLDSDDTRTIYDLDDGPEWTVSRREDEAGWDHDSGCMGYGISATDARFIALSRTALPAALATVAAQREEIARLRAEVADDAEFRNRDAQTIVELRLALDEARAGEAAWAEERRALLDVADVARELRRWDAIGALTSGDEPHASDAQDALRALDAALAKVRP